MLLYQSIMISYKSNTIRGLARWSPSLKYRKYYKDFKKKDQSDKNNNESYNLYELEVLINFI